MVTKVLVSNAIDLPTPLMFAVTDELYSSEGVATVAEMPNRVTSASAAIKKNFFIASIIKCKKSFSPNNVATKKR